MKTVARYAINDLLTFYMVFAFLLIGDFTWDYSYAVSVPQTIATSQIKFTGNRFEAQVISAERIEFTGLRFDPKNISTASIVFTGQGYGKISDISKAGASLQEGQQKVIDASRVGGIKIGGGMKTMSGNSPVGPQGQGRVLASKAIGKIASEKEAPDLVVEKFWTETIKRGEKLPNGKTAKSKHLYFNWKVRNIGDKISKSTKLRIICVRKSQDPCPSGISSFIVKQLWPRPKDPDDPSGAQIFWNQTPMPASGAQKYKFIATVDPDDKVSEKDEGNNKLVSDFENHTWGVENSKPKLKTRHNISAPSYRNRNVRQKMQNQQPAALPPGEGTGTRNDVRQLSPIMPQENSPDQNQGKTRLRLHVK